MSSLPLVSVHIVTYNQQDLIAETIESAVSQDYPALEIVVSDDASKDRTPEVVREYERRYPGRVVALTSSENLGISGNSNRCLQRCRGQYVAFLAGDDLMLPGKIRAQVDWFQADASRVLCAHDVEHFDSDSGRRIKLHSSVSPLRSGRGVAEYLRTHYFSATSSIMVRASAIPQRGFDERIRVHSDWKFATECVVRGGGFGYVPGLLGRYRRHPQNATQRHAALRWEERHVGLALLEAEYPEYVGVWERARAYAHYQRAVEFVQQGRGSDARQAIAAALRHDPAISAKLPLWWAASFAPRALLPRRLRGSEPRAS